MKNIFYLLLLTSFFISCKQSLVTGRKQLCLFYEEELKLQEKQEYHTFLNANKVISFGTNKDEIVRRVGTRIATASKSYSDILAKSVCTRRAKPQEFLISHPSDATRIANIES